MGIAQHIKFQRTKKRLDNIALLVGELASVKVRFTTSGLASTDGKNINIRVGDFADPHYVNMAIGLAFHEGGHVKHTDFNSSKLLSPKWFRVCNAFEDVRMEGLVQRDFKGAAKYLHYVNKDLFDVNEVREYTAPFSLVTDYIVIRGFTEYTGNVFLRPVMLNMRQQLFALLGDKGALEAESIIDEVDNATCTQDCVNLTIKLRDFLQQFEPEQQPVQSDDSDADTDSSDDSEADDDSSASGDDSDADTDSSDDSDADGDSAGSTNANGEANTDSSDDANGSNSPTINELENNPFEDDQIDDSECMDDLHEVVRQMLNELAEEFQVENPQEILENLEYAENMVGNIDYPGNGFDSYHGLESVKAYTNQLKLVFKRALIDQSRVRRNYVRDGGVLDGNRILDLVTNPDRACIFRNEKRAKSTSAAVSIIVDASSSMGYTETTTIPFKIANQAAFAIANALDQLRNVDCEVRHMVSNASYITKRFGQRADINRFAVKPSGCTPTAQLVRGAIGSLHGHRFDKKLIIVITDGEPDSVDTLRLAVSDAQIAGIDVKGIGINCPTYGIDDGVIIKDVRDLHSELSLAVRKGIF